MAERLNKYVCEECGERMYTPYASFQGLLCISCKYGIMGLVDLVVITESE